MTMNERACVQLARLSRSFDSAGAVSVADSSARKSRRVNALARYRKRSAAARTVTLRSCTRGRHAADRARTVAAAPTLGVARHGVQRTVAPPDGPRPAARGNIDRGRSAAAYRSTASSPGSTPALCRSTHVSVARIARFPRARLSPGDLARRLPLPTRIGSPIATVPLETSSHVVRERGEVGPRERSWAVRSRREGKTA